MSAEIHVVLVPCRVDGIYAFEDRGDAERFALAVGDDAIMSPRVPVCGPDETAALVAAEVDGDV